jgi:hypothetical protein
MRGVRTSTGRRGSNWGWLVFLVLILHEPCAANAAKWHSCPTPPFPTYPSRIGATNSPFVHPGHELTIVLNEDQVARSGGFSTEPGGNEVRVRFVSPFGPSISMPPISSDASSASLTFTFPAATEQGLPLVGPVEVIVVARSTTVAYIASQDLTALPPSNMVAPLLIGSETSSVVYGAVGADGDLWIPARMDGTIMQKPTCPGDFIFPVSIQIGALRIDGIDQEREPLTQIRGVTGYLGDVTVFDYSLYGMPFQNRIRLVHVGSTLGVSVCQLNDALDIVLRVTGDQSWTRSARSPLDSLIRGFQPVPVALDVQRASPSQATGPNATQVDSFDNDCAQPSPARR